MDGTADMDSTAGAEGTPGARGAEGIRRGRRPGRSDTKQLILESARHLFARGYEQTSIRGVAEKAGVGPALVMHYFSFQGRPLFGRPSTGPFRHG